MTCQLQAFGLTDAGRVRRTNEDQFLIASIQRGLQNVQSSYSSNPEALPGTEPQGEWELLIVADGVGGGPGGQVASRIAQETITQELLRTLPRAAGLDRNDSSVRVALEQAVEHAEARITEEGILQPHLRNMATTLTMALISDGQMYLAHVGDSRAYRLRDGCLEQLTRDHTVEEYLKACYGARAAAESPLASHLTNVIGRNAGPVHAEIRWMPLAAGDRLLLCTDGLTRYCTESELEQLLVNADEDLAGCANRCLEMANQRGGADNITVVVADYRESPCLAQWADTVVLEEPVGEPGGR